MADPVVATPAVAPAAVVETPAAKQPTAEEKFAVRKAEWVEKQKAKDAAPDPAPAPVEAKVDMDPETLAKLTEASERARAANKRADQEEAKRKEIEAGQADAQLAREGMKLWKEGKKDEAVAKWAGVEDPSDEIEDLLKRWVAKPAKDGEKKLSPEDIKALQDEAAEGKKFREAEQARVKADTDSKNARTFSAQQRDAKGDDDKPRYPLASSPENAETAATVALEKANAKLLKLGSPTVTRELAEHLFELAYAEIEANLAKDVKPPATLPPDPIRTAVRAAVVPRAGTVPATAKSYARTPEGARERLMDRAKALTEAKGERWG